MKTISAFAIMALTSSQAQADAALAETLERIRGQYQVPGVVVVVVDKHGVREELALGYADQATQRPMTTNTLVRIGSVTKTFNAIGLLRLEAKGLLSLNAPLKQIAPEVPLENPWRASRPVKLIHLIEHTAGLADLTREEFSHNESFPSLLAALDFKRDERKVRWLPGRYREYSNVGAAYLGYVIERTSGKSYEAYLRQQVLAPMGLSTATLTADADTRQRLATGYDTDGTTVIPYWHMIFPPLGAVNATPREMARLPQFFLARGTLFGTPILAEPMVDRMEKPSSSLGARAGLTFGYGLGLDQETDGLFVWYGHGGDGDGYLSHFAYQKELGKGYFLTFNAFRRDALGAFKRAIQAYLGKPYDRQVEFPPVSSVNAVDVYVGEYEKLTQRFDWEKEKPRMSVVRDRDALYLVYSNGKRLPLVRVADGLYRHPVEPIATIALVEVDERWILQGEFGSYGKLQ